MDHVAGLPAGLAPPVKVALARAIATMPRSDASPGTLLFEPKWDGYRCVAVRDDHGATLWSRQGKELTRYLPELIQVLEAAVPPGCVIDGEAVIWANGRLNFTALQQRLSAGPKTLPGLVRQTPANYVAFDVLAVAGHDARDLPLHQRRALLDELATGWEPPLSLSPATTDPDEAARWFRELPHTGVEGLIINSLLNERVDAVQEGCVWCKDGEFSGCRWGDPSSLRGCRFWEVGIAWRKTRNGRVSVRGRRSCCRRTARSTDGWPVSWSGRPSPGWSRRRSGTIRRTTASSSTSCGVETRTGMRQAPMTCGISRTGARGR